MSMSIVLSDHAASIVQAHVAHYGSVEAVIESAILRLHDEDLDNRSPEYIEYLRQALAECDEDGPWLTLDFDELKLELHAEWEAEKGAKCHT